MIGIVIYLYIYANKTALNFEAPNKTEDKKFAFFQDSSWLYKFAYFKKNNYIEPINTMLISIKLQKIKPIKKVDKKKKILKEKPVILKIKDSSEYSTFCLVQVLDSLKLEYFINKQDYLSSVFIKVKDKKIVTKIKQKLKKLNVKVY